VSQIAAAFVCSACLAFPSSATAGPQAAAAPVESLDALRPLVKSNESLTVVDASGRKTSGRLVSLTDNTLMLTRRQWNFRQARYTWTEADIREIQHKDSTWNGSLLGGAAGVVFAVAMVKSQQCDWQCLPFAALATPVGLIIGDLIDGSVNRPLYRASGGSTALPTGGRRRAAVILRYGLSF